MKRLSTASLARPSTIVARRAASDAVTVSSTSIAPEPASAIAPASVSRKVDESVLPQSVGPAGSILFSSFECPVSHNDVLRLYKNNGDDQLAGMSPIRPSGSRLDDTVAQSASKLVSHLSTIRKPRAAGAGKSKRTLNRATPLKRTKEDDEKEDDEEISENSDKDDEYVKEVPSKKDAEEGGKKEDEQSGDKSAANKKTLDVPSDTEKSVPAAKKAAEEQSEKEKPAEKKNEPFSFLSNAGASEEKPAEKKKEASQQTTSAEKKDETTPVSSSPFSFGSNSAVSGFSFGSTEPKPAEKKEEEKSSEKPAETTLPSFSFGSAQPNPSTEKKSESSLPSFTFGSVQPSEKKSETNPFSFGASQSTEKKDEPKVQFQFGTANSGASEQNGNEKKAEDKTVEEKPAEKKSEVTPFSFGLPKQTTSNEKKDETAAVSSSPFSFGSNSAVSGFSFGSTEPKPAEKKEEEKSSEKPAETTLPSFSFGSTQPNPSTEKKSDSALPSFSFGSTEKKTETSIPSFSFGSAQSNPLPSSEKKEESSVSFQFGSTFNSANAGSTEQKPAEKTGESTSNVFSFGLGQNSSLADKKTETSAPATVPSSNLFGTSATSAPVFGSATSSTPATAPNLFGAPITTSNQSPFAFQTNSIFGSTSPAVSASNQTEAPSTKRTETSAFGATTAMAPSVFPSSFGLQQFAGGVSNNTFDFTSAPKKGKTHRNREKRGPSPQPLVSTQEQMPAIVQPQPQTTPSFLLSVNAPPPSAPSWMTS